MRKPRLLRWNVKHLPIILLPYVLAACAQNLNIEQDYLVKDSRGDYVYESELEKRESEEGKVFGSALTNLFSGDKDKKSKTYGPSIEVSALLWRASLDTISFMPLKSADPFGGVIITDWYTPPETPKERLKLTVYILTRQLRSDGIRVSVFRETLNQGVWRTATVAKETAIKLENKILYRARELRIASKRDY